VRLQVEQLRVTHVFDASHLEGTLLVRAMNLEESCTAWINHEIIHSLGLKDFYWLATRYRDAYGALYVLHYFIISSDHRVYIDTLWCD
jgi:hypothetical protein